MPTPGKKNGQTLHEASRCMYCAKNPFLFGLEPFAPWPGDRPSRQTAHTRAKAEMAPAPFETRHTGRRTAGRKQKRRSHSHGEARLYLRPCEENLVPIAPAL